MVGKRKKAKKAASIAVVNGTASKAPKAKLRSAKQASNSAGKRARAAIQEPRATAEERRARKLDHRRRDRKIRPTDAEWAIPAPRGLIGRLERPRVISKHKSYFEFAENVEKKDKKLEFEVTTDSRPPPGFRFIPVGNPTLTDACKELSRDREAMYFIVSSNKEATERVYQYISRIGYHFRESIVDDAATSVGDMIVSRRTYKPDEIEAIPESQAEINKQADAAIRDLFPRIPNTDRQMIIDHAFKKGALFKGQPMVGLADDIPLSRRVQLAVLAHIRHTHTRYDLLLRETEWMNARKVVEPICLDIIVKWRGDEETGRDQLEEILREVVVITDSEGEENTSEEDYTSEEEDEEEEDDSGSSSSVSVPSVSLPNSRNQGRSVQREAPRGLQSQRGFQRYRAAWDQALVRQQENPRIPESGGVSADGVERLPQSSLLPRYSAGITHVSPKPHHFRLPQHSSQDQALSYDNRPHEGARHDYVPQRPHPSNLYQRDEITVRPQAARASFPHNPPRHGPVFHAAKDQTPPVVVRAPPTKCDFQDMLVPSIETASSDAVVDSPHHEMHRGRGDAYLGHVIEHSLQSPLQRQVIVIDDDSPVHKRQRRMFYEDDVSLSRSIPSRDQGLHSRAPRPDSHLLPTSSVQQRDFLLAHERLPSQPTQGLLRNAQPPISGSIVRDRLTVYDAPPESMYFTLPYDRYRRGEDYHGPVQREDRPDSQSHLEHRGEGSYNRQPVNGDLRMVEHIRGRQVNIESGFRDHVQRPLPLALSDQSSRPYETGRDIAVPSSSSQFRVEAPLYRTRDGFVAVPENPRQDHVFQSNTPLRLEDRPPTFTTLRTGEARSPVQYIERSMAMKDEQTPAFYSNGQAARQQRYQTVDEPLPPRPRLPPEGDSPIYVRTVRRPVIVLE
ncbi:hypothetical protein D0Z07_8369 [Hyphodiscus hymeniophilus]|uniref:DUF2293 domain-containing protein n=1 Tax=Hyphodiscus hymeniophilus TaxID=353542 RepID=A0A9P6VED1_9HELO|nr:hypothetical protein D0Z07_8369 [Hyphodiscus hymeniophilus]